MVSEYRRGWEDALDVVLTLRDWKKVENLRDKVRKKRINHYMRGP